MQIDHRHETLSGYFMLACTFAETDKTGPVDLAAEMKQGYNIHSKVYDSFFVMMEKVFDFNSPNKTKVFTVCNGTKGRNLGWKMCDAGNYAKNFDHSFNQISEKFFETEYDRPNVPNMQLRKFCTFCKEYNIRFIYFNKC